MPDRMSNASGFAVIRNPQEDALHSLCKQLLKSRLFRGYYSERRYVESLHGYRDIVMLDRSERDFEKLLISIKEKLHMFYLNKPKFWVGVSNGPLMGINVPSNRLETCVWVELEESAFGYYWFLVKSVKFRENEILLKLKVVRLVDDENLLYTPNIQHTTTKDQRLSAGESISNSKAVIKSSNDGEASLDDFIRLLETWASDTKTLIYNFMSNDINKENITSVLRFFGLLLMSLLSGCYVAVKYLGIFILQFMFEFTRLAYVMSPIVLKIIDVLQKMVGGFYILLTMIWKDTIGNRDKQKAAPMYALQYTRPPANMIKNVNTKFEFKKF